MKPTQKKKIEKGYYDPANDVVENDGEMHGTQTTQQPEQPAIATVPTQQTEQPEVQQPKSGVDGGFQGTGYGDLASWLDEQIKATTPESEAERKAREKREKLRTLIGSIADMGSAIGSLAGTTNYAPPTFDPKSGVAPKYQDMYERNKAEFKENLGRNLTYRKMRQQIDEDEQNYKLNLEKINNNRQAIEIRRQNVENATKRLEIAKTANDIKAAYNEAKIEIDRQKAETERLYREKMIDINQYNAETRRLNAQTDALENKRKERETKLKEKGKTTEVKKEIDPVTGKTVSEKRIEKPNKNQTGVINWI